MKVGVSCVRKRLLLAVSLLALASACVGPEEPVEVLLWEGSLVSRAGFTTLAGSVAMVANEHDTQIGIAVTGAQANARLGWAVRTGQCSGTGARVSGSSAYPVIAVSGEGDGRAETVLRRRIEQDSNYAAEVFANTDGSGAILACADLIPREMT